jgi:protein HIRA/HIR1
MQKIREIDCGCKIVGVVWDPYDKYVASLRFDNHLVVTRTSTWVEETRVSLNFPQTTQGNPAKHTSKKEDRKIDWSPDYRFVLLPNLDDRV